MSTAYVSGRVPARYERLVTKQARAARRSKSDLVACAESGLILVAFDRATLPWHAGRVIRAGERHGGLILFRRGVRSSSYGQQARLLTESWTIDGHTWDWLNRVVYLPTSP